jgi:hypothetical protein
MILQPLIDTLKTTLDAFVANTIAPMYAAMLPAASVITLLMVIGFGISLVAGARADGPAVFKAGSIIVLANALLHVPFYLTEFIIQPLQSFMEGTGALLISTAAGGGGTGGLVDTYENFLWDFVDKFAVIFETIGWRDGLGPFILLIVLIIPYILMSGVIILFLFEVYTVFALWQILGPIFILCFMWRPTRGIAVSSLRWLLHAAFSVIFISAIASIIVFMIVDASQRIPVSGGTFKAEAKTWFGSKDYIVMCVYGYMSLFIMQKVASWTSNLVQFFDGGGTVAAAASFAANTLAPKLGALAKAVFGDKPSSSGGGSSGGSGNRPPPIPPPARPPDGYAASTLMKTNVQ